VASSRKRGQGASWTVAPAEEEEEDNADKYSDLTFVFLGILINNSDE
jgi:hypothetical protein